MPDPHVTIAIPTYNRAGWLPRCLGSVLACERSDIEILVSDNASTDGTGNLQQRFADPRLRWTTQSTNLGMAPNWQFLLDQARGTWFLLLSDDDMVEPAALARVAETLASVTSDVVVTGLIVENHITRREHVRASPAGVHAGRDFIIGAMSGEHFALPSAMLLRTQALRSAGGYAPRPYRLAVDAAAWFEIAAASTVTVLPDVLCRYAVQPSSLTSSDSAMSDEVERLYGDWIGRLRPSREQAVRIRRTMDGGATASACRKIASAPWWQRPRLGLTALAAGGGRPLAGKARHAMAVGIASCGLMGLADSLRGRRRIVGSPLG